MKKSKMIEDKVAAALKFVLDMRLDNLKMGYAEKFTDPNYVVKVDWRILPKDCGLEETKGADEETTN